MMKKTTTVITNKVTLSVFFCGTNGKISPPTTQIGMFANNTNAENINIQPDTSKAPNFSSIDQFKMTFNGCGVDYGKCGTLFGYGLSIQVSQVVTRVKQLLIAGKRIRLNILGLSRGGIAGMLLVKKLAGIDKQHLETNLLLFDPVPGELITLRKLDLFKLGLANRSIDLSKSRNLTHVVAIYPYQPLCDCCLHAPIIPTYPDSCHVEEYVTPGCHQDALDNGERYYDTVAKQQVGKINLRTTLSFLYIKDFLAKHGAKIIYRKNICKKKKNHKKPKKYNFGDFVKILNRNFFIMQSISEKESLLKIGQSMLENVANKKNFFIKRSVHSQRRKTTIMCDKSGGKYLNLFHEKLAQQHNDSVICENSNNPYMLYIKRRQKNEKKPLFSSKQTPQSISSKILNSFLSILYQAMSKKSKKSEKGKLMQKIISSIPQELNRGQASYIIRDALALTLQRDRNRWSLLSTTTSGLKARSLLKHEEYLSIKQLIVPGRKAVKYRDLRIFVLARNVKSYFYVKNKRRTYGLINNAESVEDRYPTYLTWTSKNLR